MDLRSYIEKYEPYNEQEEKDKEYYLKFMDTFDDVLTRDNLFGHFTASALVVNHERNKMLMVHHNILGGWVYPGGHADGNDDLLSVAIREVKEETNQNVNILSNEIFGINSLPIKAHVKRGKHVPTHIHFDVVYLLESKDDTNLRYRPSESSGLKWATFNEACFSEEVPDYMRPVHLKLISKMQGKGY